VRLTPDATGKTVRVRSLARTRGLNLTPDDKRTIRAAIRGSTPSIIRAWLEKGLLLAGAITFALILRMLYQSDLSPANLVNPIPILLVFAPFVLGMIICLLALWKFDTAMRLRPPTEEAAVWLSINRCPHCAYTLQPTKQPGALQCPECGSEWRDPGGLARPHVSKTVPFNPA
jgi:ssDNA-binding Zn-finger/Zn-ribbon topoisomerase 1